jgi:hypothetical protein
MRRHLALLRLPPWFTRQKADIIFTISHKKTQFTVEKFLGLHLFWGGGKPTNKHSFTKFLFFLQKSRSRVWGIRYSFLLGPSFENLVLHLLRIRAASGPFGWSTKLFDYNVLQDGYKFETYLHRFTLLGYMYFQVLFIDDPGSNPARVKDFLVKLLLLCKLTLKIDIVCVI